MLSRKELEQKLETKPVMKMHKSATAGMFMSEDEKTKDLRVALMKMKSIFKKEKKRVINDHTLAK